MTYGNIITDHFSGYNKLYSTLSGMGFEMKPDHDYPESIIAKKKGRTARIEPEKGIASYFGPRGSLVDVSFKDMVKFLKILPK